MRNHRGVLKNELRESLFMKWWILSVSLIFLTPLSYSKTNKTYCTKVERRLKSCFLKYPPYKIHIQDNKINSYDGVWRNIVEQKISEKKAQWNRVYLKKIKHRLFLVMKVWGAPLGEANISSLYWVIYEITKKSVTERLSQVIQKKSISPTGKEYKDPQDKISLKSKGSHVHWTVSEKHGHF